MPIHLRPLLPSDLPTLFTQGQVSEAVQMAAFTAKDPNDRAAFDAHWARIQADPLVIIRAILYEGELADSVLKYDMGEPEVSYWLGKEFWGKGIATQALILFLSEVVTERPIYGRAAKDNLASLRVLEKCGFQGFGEERGFANARGMEIAELVLKLG